MYNNYLILINGVYDSYIEIDDIMLGYSAKISNLCYSFQLSSSTFDREKIFNDFIFPSTVYSIIHDRKIKFYTGDTDIVRQNKSIFSNQLTINLCNDNVNDQKILYSVKIFSTGSSQISKSKSFIEQQKIINQLREMFEPYFDQPAIEDINLRSTSINISIKIDKPTLDFIDLYNKLINDFVFYDLVCIPEIASHLRLTVRDYTYIIFGSAKITALGKNATSIDDVYDIVDVFMNIVGKHLI